MVLVSVGGKGELAPAAESFRTAVSEGTRLLRLRDRDGLTEQRRQELMKGDKKLRILERRSLEKYLLTDEALDVLVAAASTADDARPALVAVRQCAKAILREIGQLGENKYQFARRHRRTASAGTGGGLALPLPGCTRARLC